VSKVARRRIVGVLAVLIVAVMNLPAAGQVKSAPPSHALGGFAQAADATFQKGVLAKLPPHISTLLGLTKEQECEVMQGVLRNGNLVRGIDVSATKKNDVVLFTVDETANEQTLYLTSPQGTLRKVVLVKAGVGDVVRITDSNLSAFKKEKQFWIDHLAPSGPAK
jgi:hypothetical protein